jgi:hypothetical protein
LFVIFRCTAAKEMEEYQRQLFFRVKTVKENTKWCRSPQKEFIHIFSPVSLSEGSEY